MGECRKGTEIKHGKGKMILQDESVYEGYFKNNLFHGHGRMIGLKGVYIGDWQNGVRCGNGKYMSHDNSFTYVGEWKEDVRNGEGVQTYKDGSVQKGDWVNDRYILWT